MRSWLFVPGDSARKQEKCLEANADALILDLEDSVAHSKKPDARTMTRDFIVQLKKLSKRPKIFVRVNDFTTGMTDEDLEGVMQSGPDGIMLPKAVGGKDLADLDRRLTAAETRFGHEKESTRIIPVATETAAAVLALHTVAGATKRLVALTWGGEDLAADIGAEANSEADGQYTPPYVVARSFALFTAVASGVDPIDTAFINYKDDDKFREDCRISRRDGFVGRIAIHPSQVAVINEMYTPSPKVVERAKKIVHAFDANPGLGVVGIDGEMIDYPHYRQAQRILKRVQSLQH